MSKPIYPRVSLHNHLIAFVLLLLLGCFVDTSAQWTTPDGNGNIQNTNSGSVGIGTSTPNALLEIKKSQSAGTTIIIDNPFTTSPNAAYTGVFLKQNGAYRLFVGSINDNNNTHFGGSGAVQFWNFANAPMLFSTNNTEAMRLTGGGNLGLGTTSPGEKLVTMGNMLVGNINSHTQLYSTYDSQSNVIMEIGYGTATSNITPLTSLVLSKNLTSTNNSIGVISFANSNIANGSDKRLATIGAYTDGALNSGAMIFGTTNIGTLAEHMRITSGGNIGIGTSTPTEKLEVTGNIKVSGNINARYQDVAEWVDSSEDLRAGTVVVLDVKRPNHVMASTASYDTRVAGVISDRPGITLGEHADGKVLVATTGRVKIKVSAKNGPISIGDLLVTSDQQGVAMKSNAVKLGGVRLHRPGTLIGKALEPLAAGTGEILVLLSLQ
jgi:hypothetical protein